MSATTPPQNPDNKQQDQNIELLQEGQELQGSPKTYDSFEYPSYDIDDDSPYSSEYVSNYVPNTELLQRANMPLPSHVASQVAAQGSQQAGQEGSGAVAAYAAQESARKKKKATIAIIIIALLLAVLIAVVGFFAYRAHQHMQINNQVSDGITEVIGSLSKTDEYLVKLDQLLSATINPDELNQLQTMSSQAEAQIALLKDAQNKVNALSDKREFFNEEQTEVIAALSSSIDGRNKMIDAGSKILSQDVLVSQARVHVNGAYANIVEADSKVREALDQAKKYAEQEKSKASEQLKNATASNNKKKKDQADQSAAITAQSVVDLDQQALEALSNASLELQKAKAALPEVDLSPIEKYLEAKQKAVSILKEVDTAVAENKVKDAVAKVKEYNDADAEVKPLAEALPASPEQIYESYYQSKVADLEKLYDEARKAVAQADGVIRRYQGIKTQENASAAANPLGAANSGSTNASAASSPQSNTSNAR